KPSLSSDYNLLFKNKIGERSLDIHRKLMKRCAELGDENCRRACDPAFMKDNLAYWDSMEKLLNGCLSSRRTANTLDLRIVQKSPGSCGKHTWMPPLIDISRGFK
ncbi:hypothetical protein, partial [uncultured Sutterella sp.]|uniref:hypothetical protein n=1 Tax=uncultured Sutterella sp. TaxID=286133 RepID=UPI00259BE6DE